MPDREFLAISGESLRYILEFIGAHAKLAGQGSLTNQVVKMPAAAACDRKLVEYRTILQAEGYY